MTEEQIIVAILKPLKEILVPLDDLPDDLLKDPRISKDPRIPKLKELKKEILKNLVKMFREGGIIDIGKEEIKAGYHAPICRVIKFLEQAQDPILYTKNEILFASQKEERHTRIKQAIGTLNDIIERLEKEVFIIQS